jgi:alpha-maltose-1-phosphate synthase
MLGNVLIAHPGTQYSLQLARELERLNLLDSFHTCLALRSNTYLAQVAQPLSRILRMQRHLQNRLLDDVPARKLHCYPWLEIETLWRLRNRNGSGRAILSERNDRFQRSIPDRAVDQVEMVIGFDTSSRLLAQRVRSLGKKFILDRSIGHSRSFAGVGENLCQRFPEWGDLRPGKSGGELALEDEEHELADLIVAPSAFVRDTLIEQGVSAEKIRVNPFGTDTGRFFPTAENAPLTPMIFLFVGALGARKGVPLLLDAWRKINPSQAELWLAGTGKIPESARRSCPDSVRWLGAVSRSDLPELLRRAHVFVFPSFFEGLAQTQIEAAACGLPIIATKASGGEEIVAEGRTGFIVAAGTLDQLVERMAQFISDPQLVITMAANAKAKAHRWSWSAYGDRWRDILQGLN